MFGRFDISFTYLNPDIERDTNAWVNTQVAVTGMDVAGAMSLSMIEPLIKTVLPSPFDEWRIPHALGLRDN